MKKIIISTVISLFFSSQCLGWAVYGAVYQNPTGHKIMILGDYHQIGLVENQEVAFKAIFLNYLKSMLARKKPVAILVESNEEYFNRLKAEVQKGTIRFDQFSVIDMLTMLAKQSDPFVQPILHQHQMIGFPSVALTDYRSRAIKQTINLFVNYLEKSAELLCNQMRSSLTIDIKNQLPNNELLCANEFLFNQYLQNILTLDANATLALFKNFLTNYIQGFGYPLYSIQDLIYELDALHAQVAAILATTRIAPSLKQLLLDQDLLLKSLIQKTRLLFPDPNKKIVDAVIDLTVAWQDISALTDIGHESNIYSSTDRQMKELYYETLDSIIENIGDVGILLETIKAIQQNSDVILYAGMNHIERIEQLLLDIGYLELIKFDNIPSLRPLAQSQLDALFRLFNP